MVVYSGPSTVERRLPMDHFVGLENVHFWIDRSIALHRPFWPPIFDRLIFARIERNLEKLTMSNQCAMVFVNLVLVQISMAKQKCHGNVLAPRQRVAGGSFKWVLFLVRSWMPGPTPRPAELVCPEVRVSGPVESVQTSLNYNGS